jgi:hypothetical protein
MNTLDLTAVKPMTKQEARVVAAKLTAESHGRRHKVIPDPNSMGFIAVVASRKRGHHRAGGHTQG